jgi:hypothetical protein
MNVFHFHSQIQQKKVQVTNAYSCVFICVVVLALLYFHSVCEISFNMISILSMITKTQKKNHFIFSRLSTFVLYVNPFESLIRNKIDKCFPCFPTFQHIIIIIIYRIENSLELSCSCISFVQHKIELNFHRFLLQKVV